MLSENKDMVLNIAEELALNADGIISELKQVDWSKSVDIPKKMIFLIGDYIIDHIRDKYDLKLSFQDIVCRDIDVILQKQICVLFF